MLGTFAQNIVARPPYLQRCISQTKWTRILQNKPSTVLQSRKDVSTTSCCLDDPVRFSTSRAATLKVSVTSGLDETYTGKWSKKQKIAVACTTLFAIFLEWLCFFRDDEANDLVASPWAQKKVEPALDEN